MASRVSGWLNGLYGRYAGFSTGKKRRFVWMLYTGIFLFGIALAFGILLVTRRSIVWTYDSSAEYYPAMVYFSETLKRFFSGLAQGQWIWPQYDFSIGFGEDIISALNYYGFADPLFLLTALVPRSGMERAFVLLAFLRAYLAGLFFYRYIRWFGVGRGRALLGAVSYALCGFVTFSLCVHQIFLNVAMYLPLILLGFEHLLKGKRPILLPVASALLAFNGYYMLYMASAFLIAYAAFRFFRDCPAGKGRAAAFFKVFAAAAGFYALGVAVAGVTLLPSVWGFLQRAVTGRTVKDNLLFYSSRGYLEQLSRLIFLRSENLRGVAIWSFAAMLMVAVRPSARRRYLGGAAAACVLACLLIPFFGYMFNGFSYVTDRWSFMLSLLSAGALSVMFSDLIGMGRRDWLILIAAVAALFAGFAYALFAGAGIGMRTLPFAAYALLAAAATLAAMRFAQKAAGSQNLPDGARRLIPLAICAVVVVGNLGLNGLVQNALRIKDGNFLKVGAVDRLIESSPAAAVDAAQDAGFHRIEVPLNEWTDRNEAMLLGFNGTACYLSIQNANTLDSLTELESISRTILHQVLGLDQREALMALTNVRYYAKRADSPQQAPYGFKLLKKSDRFEVYENQNALPLGYSTGYVISDEDYRKMTGLERQQALLRGAVLHGGAQSTLAPADEIRKLECTVAGGNGAEWKDGTLRSGKGATLTVYFEAPAGAETYLRLSGVSMLGGANGYQAVLITGEGFEKKVLINSDDFVHGHGSDTYMINLGHHEGALTEAKLFFPESMSMGLGNIEVLSVPMDGFAAAVDALREQSMTDVVIGQDRIEGKVVFDGERVLVMGIPYSEGWTAVVDGVQTPIDPSSRLVMAVRLPEGEHRVVFTYANPWQKAGAYLSLIALAALIALWVSGVRLNAFRPGRASAGRV